MIGDRSHDIVGAKNNGIKGIGVLYGYGSKDELIGAGALPCLRHARGDPRLHFVSSTLGNLRGCGQVPEHREP